MKERLTQLEKRIFKRHYLQENVRPEIERVNLTSREDLLKKSERIVDESVTLVLTKIVRKTHGHVLKSNRLSKVLTSPPRVAFCNTNSLKYRLVRSKLKPDQMLQLVILIVTLIDATFMKF